MNSCGIMFRRSPNWVYDQWYWGGKFMIKHKLDFNPHNPTDFIEYLKELIIDLQFRNEDKAIFDKGSYELNKSLKQLTVNKLLDKWQKQQVQKIKAFKKAGLESKVNLLNVQWWQQ